MQHVQRERGVGGTLCSARENAVEEVGQHEQHEQTRGCHARGPGAQRSHEQLDARAERHVRHEQHWRRLHTGAAVGSSRAAGAPSRARWSDGCRGRREEEVVHAGVCVALEEVIVEDVVVLELLRSAKLFL